MKIPIYKCPNCNKKMIDKSYTKMEEFYHWEDEAFYYQKVKHEKFVCEPCKIKYKDGKWKIPKKYLPTGKQIKTILFINNHLNMQIEPLTKYQCWCDIKKYFNEAKNTPLHDDQYYLDLQEYYGMDESDFY